MQVRFVGCGDAFGSGGRQNTCFHVTGASVHFLIDCGVSALPALKRSDVVRNDIDLILITHFHGDHFAGRRSSCSMPNSRVAPARLSSRGPRESRRA